MIRKLAFTAAIILTCVVWVTAIYSAFAATDVFVVNPVSVKSIDAISSANSTTALLSANATFTGSWVSTIGYAGVWGEIFSDVPSAANGIKLQFSTDGINIDYVSNQQYDSVDAGIGHEFTVPARGPYYRIVYTNGSSAQASFRLQSMLKVSVNSAAIMDVENTILKHRQALLSKSIIAGETTAGGGSYVNVKVNPSGALAAAVTQDTSPWVSSITGTPHFILYDNANQDLDLVKQNDVWNAADHGIIIFGTQNTGAGPVKYQGIRVHDDGSLLSHVLDTSDNILNPATTENVDALRTALTSSYLKTSLWSRETSSLLIDSNGVAATALYSSTGVILGTGNVGSDGLAVPLSTNPMLNVRNFSMGINPSGTLDRIRSGPTGSDAIPPASNGSFYANAFGMLYDSATNSWFRARGTIATGMTITTSGPQQISGINTPVILSSGTTNPVTVIQWPHSQIHAGNMFIATGLASAPSSSWYNVFISTPSTTTYHLAYNVIASSPVSTVTCSVYLYEGATQNNGGATSVTIYNKNRGSAITTAMTVSAGGNIAPAGTLLENNALSASSQVRHNLIDDEVMLKVSTRYSLSAYCPLLNVPINWELMWYPQ